MINVGGAGIRASGGGSGYTASSVPRAAIFKTTNSGQDTTLTSNSSQYQLTITATARNLNLFTLQSDGTLLVTSTTPFYADISGQITGYAPIGALVSAWIARNNLAINSTDKIITSKNTRTGSWPINPSPLIADNVLFQYGDVISVRLQSSDNSTTWTTETFDLSVDFKGWTTVADTMSAELFSNPTITSASGFTGSNATVSASGGVLTITSTAASGYAAAAVTGLTAGNRYRVAVSAKRGAQGTTQAISNNTFGGFTSQSVTTTSYVTYYLEVVSTSTGGDIQLDSSIGGASNDSMLINSLSVKGYL